MNGARKKLILGKRKTFTRIIFAPKSTHRVVFGPLSECNDTRRFGYVELIPALAHANCATLDSTSVMRVRLFLDADDRRRAIDGRRRAGDRWFQRESGSRQD